MNENRGFFIFFENIPEDYWNVFKVLLEKSYMLLHQTLYFSVAIIYNSIYSILTISFFRFFYMKP